MKVALYIEDGVVQLVMTPESEFEKNSLSTFRDKPLDAKLFPGSFYDCRGGWVRQSAYQTQYRNFSDSEDHSLILVAREAEPESKAEEVSGVAMPINPMIAAAILRNEDATGLCTVREFAAALLENPVFAVHGETGFKPPPPGRPRNEGFPWGEMTFTHNGKRFNVEMVVTRCEPIDDGIGIHE